MGLDNLINVGTVDRGFRRIYGEVDVAGAYHRRAFDFKLIVELVASDGGIYLRATDEAINVLVGALDTDVESAQIAAEVKLESLISRGRLADAKLAAEQAPYRTVQYGEMLSVRLDATRRDVRAVDWEREIPELVDSALSHIEDRFRTENAILRHITDARDEAEDPDHKRRAAELIEIVDDCIQRHTALLGRLQAAGSIFRAEQDRQQFSGTPERAAVDLFGQLLNPVIGLSIADAVAPLQAFFQGASGVSAPSLPALVALLLRPAPEREQFVGEVPQPELLTTQDAGRYTEEHWRLADGLLDLSGTTRGLSDILADAGRIDPDLSRLVVLRAVHAYSPGIGAAIRRKSRTVLLAVPRGRELDAELSQPFCGDDLLLTTAVVSNEIHIVESDLVEAGEEGVSA